MKIKTVFLWIFILPISLAVSIILPLLYVFLSKLFIDPDMYFFTFISDYPVYFFQGALFVGTATSLAPKYKPAVAIISCVLFLCFAINNSYAYYLLHNTINYTVVILRSIGSIMIATYMYYETRKYVIKPYYTQKPTPDQKLKAYKKIITYLKEQDKKNKSSVLMVLLFSISANSQVKSSSLENVWIAKEYSKEAALWNSKDFLFNNVLKIGEYPLKFEVIPLAAASSGDLTTLIYKSEADGKEGLILGFYGNFWNDAGVLYLGYRFKNLEKEKAIEFLDKIQNAIDQHSKYMKSDSNNNNIVFKYDDLKVLIFDSPMGITTRIFWEGFDSTWEKTAFDRSKRRFEKKIK